MAASNGEDITCNYCLQALPHMIDPRELPCYHIFCLPCLQSDYNISAGIQCTVCRKQYDSIELTNLKSCTVDDTAEPKVEYYCFECDDVLSAGYCLTCGQHKCDSHMKKHVEAKHETIDISTFNINPSTYFLVFCDEHKKEISMVCSGCLMFACGNCDTHPGDGEGNCPGTFSAVLLVVQSSHSHNLISLRSMQRLVEKELDEKLKVSADKITEICKLEKEVWLKLDSEGTNNEVLQNELTNEVEVFVCTLMSIKDQLEVIQRSIRQLQRESHITEVIKQKPQKISELDENCSKASEIIRSRRDGTDDLEGLFKQLTIQPAIQQSNHRNAPLSAKAIDLSNITGVSLAATQPRAPPTYRSLRLLSEHATTSRCFSVRYKEDGGLVVACNNRIYLYDDDMDRSRVSLKARHPTGAAEHVNGGIYYIDDGRKEVRRWVPPLDEFDTERVFSYNAIDGGNYSDLAISEDCLTVTEDDGVLKYNIGDNVEMFFELDSDPCYICYHSDGDLLATSVDDTLTKYDLSTYPARVQWEVDGLAEPAAICKDARGMIFVGSNEKKVIYVISPTGELVSRLSHRELPTSPGNMSIRGNTLAIACEDDDCFKLFAFS